jgi:hypothetical protein
LLVPCPQTAPASRSEVQAELTAGHATGFVSYADVTTVFGSLPLR